MAEVGRTLSEKLRDPSGSYKVDLVIALTHARYAPILLIDAYNLISNTEFQM